MQLGSEPYQRLSSLLQIGQANNWFKPESETQKRLICEGFKELYNRKKIKICNTKELVEIFLDQLKLLTEIPETKEIEYLHKPKSTVRDINAFNQRGLFEHIKS